LEWNRRVLAAGTGMEGFWLPAHEWRGSIAAGTEMEVFYSYLNGMEGFWLPALEWRDSSCRHRNEGVLQLPERNGGILAAGTGMGGVSVPALD
jgi:hypothetical protein